MSDVSNNLFEQLSSIIESFQTISITKLQEIFLYVVFLYSTIHTHASVTIKKLSDEYVVFKAICDAITYANTEIETKMHKLFATHRFEPEYSPWINSTWLNGDNDTVEEYFDFSKDENACQEYMNSYFETAIVLAMQNQNPNDAILIMRYENKTRCNIIEQKESRDVYEYSASNVKFIAIEYKHKLMKEAIPIELDRSWFLSGNQLLSDVFVRRYLDYQPTPFYYDETYTITLIDNNMNIITIDNTQYVMLEKDNYRIIKREFDENTESDTESTGNDSFESASNDKIDLDDISE
jgi:hypothetical protein